MTDRMTTTQLCDLTMERAVKLMESEGADVELILDRVFTFGASVSILSTSAEATAQQFEAMAKRVRAGALAQVEAIKSGTKH